MWLKTIVGDHYINLPRIWRHKIMHSSAGSSIPFITISEIKAVSVFSGTFSTNESIRAYAAFLIGIPSSFLCLNGPKSTSVISSGLILVSAYVTS